MRRSVSIAELRKAYRHFGLIHVVDPGQDQRSVPPASTPEAARELDNFARSVKVSETHFGRSITAVAYGYDIPEDRDARIRTLRSPFPLWRNIRAAKPLRDGANMSPSDIRGMLRSRRFVKISSRDGRAHLVARLGLHGELEHTILGDVEAMEHEYAALAGHH